MVTRDRAARIAGIRPDRVDYWVNTGVITATVQARLAGRVRAQFSYVELLGLLVAAELRRNGVSLQYIRAIVDHLKSRGYDSPLTTLKYAVTDGELYFQDEDGVWEGTTHPGQIVLHQVIDLAPLRAAIRDGVQRDAAAFGQIERKRGRLGSKPVLAGTRVPVATVKRYLAAGKSDDEILAAFPSLAAPDIEAARQSA